MIQKFENIINLAHPQPSPSATLNQHCSAMRMDHSYNCTINKLNYALAELLKLMNKEA